MKAPALALALCAASAGPAVALDCRLALAIAMDVSSSVDADEDRLQREGLAAALVAPEVQAAFLRGNLPVALAVYEWSGRWNQKLLVDWVLVRHPGDLARVANQIAGSERSTDQYPTAMGYALGYGAGLLREAPPCLFQTIDLAGDGINNEGFAPESAYAAFPFAQVTVNGLVIDDGSADEVSVRAYYAAEVLRGPLAFLEVADGFEDYHRAMRRKLEREVSSQLLGMMR
ncbi:DUF1194 domain-containing protein [Roseisalinus antarcticus]|uniref:VWFA domain-containing protein n=1 Tax=Roseisalinus antarcticus TaxID=254357 RepID=A0A1Y5SWC1_9RHOB|nr:DUF1194 domain-containing protein [Roseisalinus antarcticus]SLN48049.1 hypothetical protein ROA7023_02059 [Roseisalinus antarcticus]